MRSALLVVTLLLGPIAVPALHCYVSDMAALLTGQPLTQHYLLEDCSAFIQQLSQHPTPADHLHCFTISADYLDASFKGCLPEGYCPNMTEAFLDMVRTNPHYSVDYLGQVKCLPCPRDKCNLDNEEVGTTTPKSVTGNTSNFQHSVILFLLNVFLIKIFGY